MPHVNSHLHQTLNSAKSDFKWLQTQAVTRSAPPAITLYLADLSALLQEQEKAVKCVSF